MGWGNQDYKSPDEASDTTLEDQSLSTSQEAIPLPYVAGERRVSGKWITNILAQWTLHADSPSTGKK